MKFDPKIHHRRSIRLQGYDYSQAGAYYITIVAQERECLFGEIMDATMQLNEYGQFVAETWQWLEQQYPYVELGAWVVMPNHLHGIIILHEYGGLVGAVREPPLRANPTSTMGAAKPKSLGRLIGAFKTISTKKINILRNTEGAVVWQRNYYEHIIRNDDDYNRIHLYIESNIDNWSTDDENLIKPK
jgi:putative transposase